VRRGAGCPTTCHPGKPSTSRRSAGWRLASSNWPTICGHCCVWPPDVRPSRARPSSTAGPCAPQPESGERAGYDGAKRKKGSKVHLAVDTLGHPLVLHVTPADADDRAQVGRLAQAVQAATGDSVDLAYVDQGYTGEKPAKAARTHGIELEVVKLPEAKRGFVLLPRRWVVERSFAWVTPSGISSKITSAIPARWQTSTSSPSSASCSNRPPNLQPVHNSL
jgi:transposase